MDWMLGNNMLTFFLLEWRYQNKTTHINPLGNHRKMVEKNMVASIEVALLFIYVNIVLFCDTDNSF